MCSIQKFSQQVFKKPKKKTKKPLDHGLLLQDVTSGLQHECNNLQHRIAEVL